MDVCRSLYRGIGLLALGLIASLVAPSESRAAVIFDQGNTSILGITGNGANQITSPYAFLDITGNTTNGQVTFTLSTSAHNAASPINSVFSQISFNTELALGTDFTLLSASNGNGISNGGNVSSFGAFDYTVGGASKGSRAVPFTFVLQLTDFAKALPSNFTVANGLGNSFSAHMFTDIQGSGGGVTGFIAAESVPVPEPATLSLFLVGLIPLGIMRIRRRAAANLS